MAVETYTCDMDSGQKRCVKRLGEVEGGVEYKIDASADDVMAADLLSYRGQRNWTRRARFITTRWPKVWTAMVQRTRDQRLTLVR